MRRNVVDFAASRREMQQNCCHWDRELRETWQLLKEYCIKQGISAENLQTCFRLNFTIFTLENYRCYTLETVQMNKNFSEQITPVSHSNSAPMTCL
jgi:hypothetical protein